MSGACKFCGQYIPTLNDEVTGENAWCFCDCDAARTEKRIIAQITAAHDRIDELFGETAEMYGYDKINDAGIITLLKTAAEFLARGTLSNVQIKLGGGKGAAKLSYSGRGSITVTRTRSRSVTLEAEYMGM